MDSNRGQDCDPRDVNVTVNLQGVSATPVEKPEARKITRDDAIEIFEQSLILSEAVESRVNERISAKVLESRSLEALSAQAFSAFDPSRHSIAARQDITYVAPGDSPAVAMERVIAADVQAMHQFDRKQGLSMRLTPEEMVSLGIQRHTDGTVPAQDIDIALIFDHILKKMSTSEIFASPLSQQCKAKIAAKRMIEEATTSSTTNSSTGNQGGVASPSAVTATTQQLVQSNVQTQMQHVTAPEGKVIFGEKVVFGEESRTKQGEIDKSIQSLDKSVQNLMLRGGPADVTAYHDFYDLQIAFRHVWTELLDSNLWITGQRLYEELVRVKQPLTIQDNSSTTTIKTSQDLKNLKDELKRLRATIGIADQRLMIVMDIWSDCSPDLWVKLDEELKDTLYTKAIFIKKIRSQGYVDIGTIRLSGGEIDKPFIQEGKKLIERAKSATSSVAGISRIEKMISDLEERIEENYAFDIFKPNSINYGILVTYRQQWKPLNYQVGELVSTIPLAPKEIRRFTKKRIVRKNRSEKELENSLRIKKSDTSDTSRVNAEIVRRAENKTNFQHTAEGGVNFAVWNAKGSHSLAIDAAKHSAQTKQEFRESVLKAAEEYKQEHRLEIETTASEEYEESTSGEISNPNDEIPVTYLFYELQRRYEISEKIHKITPVILVANDVPYPSDIDEDWLLAHDWILRKAILDDSYLSALDYLSKKFVGDEISIDVLRNNWQIQLDVVGRISQQVSQASVVLEEAQRAVNRAVEEFAKSQTEESEGFFESVGEFLFGGDDENDETLRIRMEAAKEALQRAEQTQQELRSRLGSEITALNRATDSYTQALEDQFNRRTEILRLRAHVKDNILYYMQAIWDQEPPDQRFFRFYTTKVKEFLFPKPGTATVQSSTSSTQTTLPSANGVLHAQYIMPPQILWEEKELVEIADLDNPLGYKGNYIIFPLKKTRIAYRFGRGSTAQILGMEDRRDRLSEQLVDAEIEKDEAVRELIQLTNFNLNRT